MTRASAPRAAFVGRALGLALVLCGLGVLLMVGIWASRLGAPPAWAFDCNDTTCEDLWAEARRHYLWTAAGAGIAVMLGAMLTALALPSTPVPPTAPARSRLLRLLLPLFAAAALLWVAGWLTLSFSRPAGLGVALLGCLLAAVAAWRWVRPGALSERQACLLAVAGIATPFVVLAMFAAITPLGIMAGVLVGVILTFYPLVSVPAMTGVLATGALVAGTLVHRTPEDSPELIEGRPTEGRPTAPEPPAPDPYDAAAEIDRPTRFATALGVALLVGLAVVSALPVDAPSADAWQYAGSHEPAPDSSGSAAGGGEPGSPGPQAPSGGADGADGTGETDGSTSTEADVESGAGRPAAPTPAVDAADLPTCTAESLQLVAEGWDGLMGDSAATLRATHHGTAPCALRGTPTLTLTQGGEEIALRPEPLRHLTSGEPSPDGVALAPGDSAVSRLYWPGYRTAADQRTPQTLTLQIEGIEEPLPVALAPDLYGDDVGPAPFDLKAGVKGGAVIEVGPWETAPPSAG